MTGWMRVWSCRSLSGISRSRDMKKRGFKFFGSTICYAFLQATGFVNDHLTGCRCKGGRQQTAP